ncbi:MAG: Rv2578c family radical SAM protein [Acidimicrobiales bacterium]
MPGDREGHSLRWRLADEDDARAPAALFPDESLMQRHVGTGEYRGLEFLQVNARRIINNVPKTSHMPFRYTINAYRGCSHACSYCFARPTHDFLGLGIGEDFDRKIVVKVNAVDRVAAEVRAPRWSGEHIAMGTNTDPYQKAEGKYHLTRGIIEVLGEARNPFSILTKSTLVLRDLDVLVAAAQRTSVRLNFSIGTLDRAVWRFTEPGTPRPDKRVEAVKRLNDAGVACGVLMGPVLPGLSDSPEQLREVIDACVAAGAVSISAIALHLRPGVREHYLATLTRSRPDLIRLYEHRFTGRSGLRAYQPKTVQAELASTVRTLVREAEARAGRPTRMRVVESLGDTRARLAEQGLGPVDSDPGRTGMAPAVPDPVAEQLRIW